MKLNQIFLKRLTLGIVLGLTLLGSGCQTETPGGVAAKPGSPPVKELRFDMRYWDSISMPNPSARTLREKAIYEQLLRLKGNPIYRDKNGKLIPAYRNKDGIVVPVPREPGQPDSIHESFGSGPSRGFANQQEYLDDIHRKVDSLKVLEHIPLTPYY